MPLSLSLHRTKGKQRPFQKESQGQIRWLMTTDPEKQKASAACIPHASAHDMTCAAVPFDAFILFL
jgi:hypothetical protein